MIRRRLLWAGAIALALAACGGPSPSGAPSISLAPPTTATGPLPTPEITAPPTPAVSLAGAMGSVQAYLLREGYVCAASAGILICDREAAEGVYRVQLAADEAGPRTAEIDVTASVGSQVTAGGLVEGFLGAVDPGVAGDLEPWLAVHLGDANASITAGGASASVVNNPANGQTGATLSLNLTFP